jgi:parallel beta-helix repeat protein
MHVLRMHGDGATYNEYVWNAVTEEYELDTILGDVALGFTSKEACIALDSTGQAYVAYEQAGDIVIEHSTNPTRSAWSSYVVATGTVPGVGNRAALMPYTDSVSGGQVGLLYFSDSSTLTFRLHDDDAADGPGVWTGETVDASITANDHTCLRSHAATGDLFAVVKNAMDDVILYKRPDGGSWGSKTIVTTGAGQVTRPQLVLDEDADEVHVFWTNWIENTIVHKKAPIGTLIFGEETVVIAKPGESVNNVQLSKHGVGSVTGLMVTAASSTHTWYNGPDKGGARIGLSFGGGGTSPDSICEDETCTPEHQNGIMRNNIIVNCNDVGIYLNDALNCEIHNNTLYGNLGIDVRYEQSIVDLRNNLLTGQIRERNGGTSTTGSNIEEVGNAAFEAWFSDPANFDLTLVGDGSSFVDQGEIVSTVSDDFCGGSRDAPYDIGAVEYDLDVCDTTERLSLLVLPPPPPPTGPADTLRLAKSADRQNVDLFWMPGPDAFWNVYRDGDPAAAGQTPLRSLLATPFTSDIAALNDPAPYFYVVRGVAACTGDEAD